jgi:hypothetical protein
MKKPTVVKKILKREFLVKLFIAIAAIMLVITSIAPHLLLSL